MSRDELALHDVSMAKLRSAQKFYPDDTEKR